MHQRLTFVSLGVKDIARSRGFYEKLGWKAANGSNDDIVFFQVGSIVLGLYGLDRLQEEAGISAPYSPGGMTLACNVATRDEVDAAMAEVVAAGATLLAPAVDKPWGGYVGYFADLDGHPWEVTHAPMLTLTEDGGLLMPG